MLDGDRRAVQVKQETGLKDLDQTSYSGLNDSNGISVCSKEKTQSRKALSFFCGGGDWTRTRDLLRIKIRLDVKGLLLGAFRHFWLRFFRTGKRLLSTVSTR